MRVFVMGATGFNGTAVVGELLPAGHEVLGLARSEVGAEILVRLGLKAQRGDPSDTDSLSAGDRACDGMVHMAFVNDFFVLADAAETDRRAVEALAGVLEGSGKPLVVTSGISGRDRFQARLDCLCSSDRIPEQQGSLLCEWGGAPG